MYKRPYEPKRDDLVYGIVESFTDSAVFVNLEDYEGRGIVPISEIPRKFVRKMKTYFPSGKRLVLLVMGHDGNFVTLSQRRVGEGQARTKLKELADEKRIFDLLRIFSFDEKIPEREIYEEVVKKIYLGGENLFPVFLKCVEGDDRVFSNYGIEGNFYKKLCDYTRQRIVLPKARIVYTLKYYSEDAQGVNFISDAYKLARETAKKNKVEVEVLYLAAGKYMYKAVADNFKLAERVMQEIILQTEKLHKWEVFSYERAKK